MSRTWKFVLLFFAILLMTLTIYNLPNEIMTHDVEISLVAENNLLHISLTAGQKSSSHVIDGDEQNGIVVVELTANNFNSFIAEKKYVMVHFYATWCGHSKRLEPEYEAAAALLKGDDQVALARVDADMETELARKYSVSGYPTVFLFVGRVHMQIYKFNRTRDGIVSWIKRNIGAQNGTEMDEAQRILTMNSSMKVVGFFDNLEAWWRQDTFKFNKASELHPDVNFFQTDCPEVAKMFNIDPQIKRPALIMLEKGAKNFRHFDVPFTASEIAEFVSIAKSPPLVTTFTEENAPWIFQSPRKQLWLFETKSESNKSKPAFEEASKALGRELEFVYAEIGNDYTGRLVSKFELKTDAPRLIATGKNGKRYLFNGVITPKTIKSFGEDFLHDKLPDELELI